MKFSPRIIEQIKGHIPLSQYVGVVVRLKKSGRGFAGLCPFHKEKSPSFSVNDEKGFYHCFGCGEHGDVISFVMKTRGLSYPETVETLAKDAGIRIERVESKEGAEQKERSVGLYEILEETAKFFERQLASPSGMRAREYLEKRSISAESVRGFRLGFSPNSYNALRQHLTGKGFNLEICVVAGVLSKGDNGDIYDRFRNRIIFPINDAKSRVIAFGGRVLDDSLPKYLNSPETELFKKSEVLYGFDSARTAIYKDGKALLVEGYLDVISLRQKGFAYAVAPLGTALTRQHLELLWRTTRSIIICLDGDTAGQNAMHRAAEIALEVIKPGFELDFCLLPKGHDPDSFVQAEGEKGFARLMESKVNLAESIWQRFAHDIESGSPAKRADSEKALIAFADKIAEPVLKKHFRDFFSSHIWKASRKKPVAKSSTPALKISGNDNASFIETAILRLVLKHPEILADAEIESEFASLSFLNRHLEAYRHTIEEKHFAGEEIAISIRLDGQAEQFAASVLADASDVKELWKTLLGSHSNLLQEKTKTEALGRFGGDITEDDWRKFLEIHAGAK